jgi:hypothetical protein
MKLYYKDFKFYTTFIFYADVVIHVQLREAAHYFWRAAPESQGRRFNIIIVEIILFSFLNIFCSQQYFCTRRYIYTREFEVRNLYLNDFENKDGETPLFNYCCFHRNRNVSRAIAHDEDLENLLLSLQDSIKWIDGNEFPGSFNFLEHLRDRLQG